MAKILIIAINTISLMEAIQRQETPSPLGLRFPSSSPARIREIVVIVLLHVVTKAAIVRIETEPCLEPT